MKGLLERLEAVTEEDEPRRDWLTLKQIRNFTTANGQKVDLVALSAELEKHGLKVATVTAQRQASTIPDKSGAVRTAPYAHGEMNIVKVPEFGDEELALVQAALKKAGLTAEFLGAKKAQGVPALRFKVQ